MRRVLLVSILVFILSGCANSDSEFDRALTLRKRIINSGRITFDAVVTADYGTELYTFKMHCQADQTGQISFSVIEPETIKGISGTVSSLGGALTFDDQILTFPLLADGQVTPVSAPWIILNTLRSGYIAACGNDEDLFRLQLDDSYADNALHTDIWIDLDNVPVRAEILWKGRRILSLEINDLTFQ